MTQIYQQFAYNSLLANHRLLSAAEALGPGEFQAPRTGFFPSIKETLNHNITVDWFYVDALEGGTLGAKAWEDPTPFDKASDLKKAQREVDFRLIRFCETLTPESLTRQMKFYRFDEPLGNVLSHLFQHQIHHRGQAHAMFSGSSVPPPQLDEFMFASDHADRASDLKELGLTEQDLPNFQGITNHER